MSLQAKLIKSLEKNIETGYYTKGAAIVARLQLDAVRAGRIRITKEVDELSTFDDCHEGLYLPLLNTDLIPAITRQKKAAKARWARVGGAYIFASEFWTGRVWDAMVDSEADNSIGGVIGDDFFGSGYELQIMQEALDHYNQQTLKDDGFPVDTYNHKD